MRKAARKNHACIDNDYYDNVGDVWRRSDSPLSLLQCSINPARISYYRKILFTGLKLDPEGKPALEVGCGGGLLCEEIARMGFDTAGIDPSGNSLGAASIHAEASGLHINYVSGSGEDLPYADHSKDVVFCCDVLEHVRDPEKVISEISRVLKPGGVFCYDTFNRTLLSKLVAVKIAQQWRRWAFAPPNLHVWSMFITPRELKAILVKNNLEVKDQKGLRLNVSLLKFLHCLRKRAKGLLTYRDIGEKFHMVESKNKSIMYMGYAIKIKHMDG